MSSTMQRSLIAIALCVAMTGCNTAESPGEVRRDVAKAQREAAEDVAETRRDATGGDAAASGSLAQGTAEAIRADAGAAKEVAIAEAEGTHKVEIEKCEALRGDAQRACTDAADAALDRAREGARAGQPSTVPGS